MMGKRKIFSLIVLLFFLIVLCLGFSSFSSVSQRNNNELSIILEGESGKIPTNEEKKVAQKNEMIAFFQLHQEEMEQFAFHMKAMEDQDPEHTYLFAVKESALYRFDGVHIKAQEKITEHPILSEAAFFGHDESFDWVAWSSNWFEREACTFVGEVYDEHGRLYAELFLFYSEEKPVTNEYQPVESLGGNWYFYVEYRE